VAAARSGGLEVAAIWTHFPVADEDAAFTRHQIEVFDEASSGYDTPLTHLANTAGAVLFPESRRSFARIGLGIYGLHPCAATREVVQLRPAMRIVTHVSHVQRLERGARPSYGRTRQLSKESTVVTAPIGYADGLPRRLSAVGAALIGGNPYPLAGTVTMDQIVIDVGDAEVRPGDEVIVLGDQGNSEVNADDWARILDTISYEVVCGIGPRVPRRYLA
jgi:alanine racemase